MKNIVYILGAGFSAPGGIPTMAEFLQSARDIRQDNPGDGPYAYFGKVLDQFATPTRILPYYKADTFNIEEILSILEMESLITQKPGKTKIFEQFITDVIEYHSQKWDSDKIAPLFELLQQTPSQNRLINYYLPFVLNIFRHDMELSDDIRYEKDKLRPRLKPWDDEQPRVSYSVITLNYDRLLENSVSYINRFLPPHERLSWGTKSSGKSVALAHLHGSTDGLGIISPTWNKSHIGSKQKKELFQHWLTAHQVLSNANEIRFLGYSLPESDSYIKYLLKSAGLTCRNLQQISVICRDEDGSVKKRFLSLFNENRFRFASADLVKLFRGCGPQNTLSTMHVEPLPLPWPIGFNTLEVVHDQIFKDEVF